MLFNDYRFLLLFLPLVLLLFFVVAPRRRRRELLILASLIFYGYAGVDHAVVLALGVVWVYVATRPDSVRGGRLRLIVAIAGPLAALFYFKYAGFAVDTLRLATDGVVGTSFTLFDDVLLPAGISFFTFQMVAFAIDRYRGQIVGQPPLRSFALYVSFFPQLVAGPILRFDHVADAIRRLTDFVPARRDIEAAVGFICLGLAAKVLGADALANVMKPFVVQPDRLGLDGAWFVALGYSFQIYFDFFGYSLIAIGLGRLFGFHFPDNFRRPYEALNPRDFWRRWHITLSYWIRDYLYLPLGGNRRYAVNIAIVFVLCGLWHGAGWNFVAWGLYHAGLVAGYRAVRPAWDRLPALLQRTLTFLLVTLGWSLFLYDFEGAAALLRSLAGFGAGTAPSPPHGAWLLLAAVAAVCFGTRFERMALRDDRTGLRAVAYGGGLACLLFAAFVFIDRSQTFIYFRF